MLKIYSILLIFLLIGCSNSPTSSIIIPDTEKLFLKSVSNHINYKLFISLPEDYKSEHNDSERYPVLYLLDPDDSFAMAHDIVRNLTGYGELKKIIIIGIGYKDQDKELVNNTIFWSMFSKNRARDYIPFPIIKGIDQLADSGGNEYKDMIKNSGQGNLFYDFLSHELIPFINKKFRTNNENILYGHSQGGLFASWVMINHPETFNGYIILSPSLWMEKGYLLEQAKILPRTAKGPSIQAYLAGGSLEAIAEKKFPDYPMISDLKKFHTILSTWPELHFRFEILPQETHASIIAVGLTHGLTYLFGIQD